MTQVFLYGTLMHEGHRAAVLGRETEATPAVLDGWRRGRAKDAPRPALAPAPAARTEGLVLEAGAGDLARLDRYEGAHGRARAEVTLSDGGPAVAYLREEEAPEPSEEWSLDAWARDWADLAVETAREAMEETGDLSALMPSIRRRAAARIAARSKGGEDRRGDVEILHRERRYSSFYALDEIGLRHRRFDGEWSPPLMRAVLVGADAVIVLPYDPVRDRVLVVEQLRVGCLARGALDPWSIEPVAGLLDANEAPEDCARREACEEAGIEIGALHAVASGYASPGTTSQFHHHFLGLCDLPDDAAGLGGPRLRERGHPRPPAVRGRADRARGRRAGRQRAADRLRAGVGPGPSPAARGRRLRSGGRATRTGAKGRRP